MTTYALCALDEASGRANVVAIQYNRLANAKVYLVEWHRARQLKSDSTVYMHSRAAHMVAFNGAYHCRENSHPHIHSLPSQTVF